MCEDFNMAFSGMVLILLKYDTNGKRDKLLNLLFTDRYELKESHNMNFLDSVYYLHFLYTDVIAISFIIVF